MSSQGTASNINGNQFKLRMVELVAAERLPHKMEFKKYIDAQGTVLRHDILLELPDSDVVVECKWHGTARGSIGQKLAYTMLWLSELEVPSIILIGGHWPTTIVGRVRAHAPDKVRIIEENEWRVWLRGQAHSG